MIMNKMMNLIEKKNLLKFKMNFKKQLKNRMNHDFFFKKGQKISG